MRGVLAAALTGATRQSSARPCWSERKQSWSWRNRAQRRAGTQSDEQLSTASVDRSIDRWLAGGTLSALRSSMD